MNDLKIRNAKYTQAATESLTKLMIKTQSQRSLKQKFCLNGQSPYLDRKRFLRRLCTITINPLEQIVNISIKNDKDLEGAPTRLSHNPNSFSTEIPRHYSIAEIHQLVTQTNGARILCYLLSNTIGCNFIFPGHLILVHRIDVCVFLPLTPSINPRRFTREENPIQLKYRGLANTCYQALIIL